MLLRSRAALLAGVCCLAVTGPAAAETLTDALTMAYQSNPQLQTRRAQLRALDESYVQARAGYRPVATFDSSTSLLDATYTRPSPRGFGRTGDDVTRGPETLALQASASQPLYTGGRVTAQVREVEANILSGREQLRALENDVFAAVIQAYVDVLRRQLEETRARFEVGEITRTDVAQGEARLAAAQAVLAQQQAQLATSRANYVALVGQSPTDLEPEPALTLLPASVDQAYETAQTNNPDLLAAELTEQASRSRVARERAETRPSVRASTSAGYQRELDFSPLDRYSANLTAGATLTLPLYRGGATTSRIRAALQTNNADLIAIETARRSVVQQVAQAWNALQAQRAALVSNEEQVRAARIAFEGVQAETQAGLRTTLDVLNAVSELREAELAFTRARRDAYVAGASVLNAMGLLEARYMTPGVAIYDPAASFNRIRRANSLPWEPIVEGLDRIGAPQVEPRPPLPTVTVAKRSTPAAETQATASLDALVDASLARP